MDRRATIADVADRAGVSRAAVSKVLRDAYGVSDAMRRRVGEAMEALAYRPQTAARGLRGSTDTLGFVLPDLRNPFFPVVFDGVTRRLAETRYQPLLGVRRAAHDNERAVVEIMLDRKLDGLIMIPARLDLRYLADLARRVPLVVIGEHSRGGGYDTVNGDDALGARLAVEHLAAAGRRRIAFVGLARSLAGPTSPSGRRRAGYEQAMKALGLKTGIAVAEIGDAPHTESDRAALRRLLSRPDRPTALFCWTDGAALLAIETALALGLALPRDLAVVGYDDAPASAHPLVGLSSINQSGERLGELAADALVERCEGRSAERHDVVAPRLVVRRTSGG